MFKYTLCLIQKGSSILLLNREKPSWMGSWNGVGGKITEGETPDQCVLREVLEETGIQLKEADYRGIVSWRLGDEPPSGGMYVFTATIGEAFLYETPRKTEEGILDWKQIDWILHPENTGVAKTLTRFLPLLLKDHRIYEHCCHFVDDQLVHMESKPLAHPDKEKRK